MKTNNAVNNIEAKEKRQKPKNQSERERERKLPHIQTFFYAAPHKI